MRDIFAAEKIKTAMQPLLEKGFFFEYFYEKDEGGVPVYICRFKKDKEYFDWRESEDGKQIKLWVCLKDGHVELDLKKRYRKQHRKFFWKHFFKRATVDERRAFIAGLLVSELQSEKTDFFGIKK